jgi:hypothetical protein
MDGDLRAIHAEQRVTSVVEPAVPPLRRPERIATLCRRVMAHPLGGPLALDLPDLAGCYDYDL